MSGNYILDTGIPDDFDTFDEDKIYLTIKFAGDNKPKPKNVNLDEILKVVSDAADLPHDNYYTSNSYSRPTYDDWNSFYFYFK